MRLFLMSLLLVAPCVLLTACDNDKPSGYFPLNEGLSWTYDRSQIIGKQAWPDVEQFSVTNTGAVRINNGDSSYLVQARHTSDGTDYYFDNGPQGIARIAKRTIVELKPRFDDLRRIVLPNIDQLKLGALWNLESGLYILRSRPGYQAEMKDKRLKMVFEVINMDATVDVPAGRFEHCLLIEGYASLTLYADARLGYIDVPITQKEWYAPGVGLVKLERNEPIEGTFFEGGKISLELTKFGD